MANFTALTYSVNTVADPDHVTINFTDEVTIAPGEVVTYRVMMRNTTGSSILQYLSFNPSVAQITAWDGGSPFFSNFALESASPGSNNVLKFEVSNTDPEVTMNSFTMQLGNFLGNFITITSPDQDNYYAVIIRSVGEENITFNNAFTTSNTEDPNVLGPGQTNSYSRSSSTTAFCLTEGTEILTESGYRPIETISCGEFVITDDGRKSLVTGVNSSSLFGGSETWPIIVPKNYFGNNIPDRDTRMTKYHMIKHNDQWTSPEKLTQDKSKVAVKYYHLKLENYFTDNLVINGGLVVESLGHQTKETSEEWGRRFSIATRLENKEIIEDSV